MYIHEYYITFAFCVNGLLKSNLTCRCLNSTTSRQPYLTRNVFPWTTQSQTQFQRNGDVPEAASGFGEFYTFCWNEEWKLFSCIRDIMDSSSVVYLICPYLVLHSLQNLLHKLVGCLVDIDMHISTSKHI